jgi:hypothetical protein
VSARLRRRHLATVLPLALGESVLLAACGAPRLAPPAASAGASAVSSNDATSDSQSPFILARPDLGKRGSAKLEYFNLPAGETATLLNLTGGPGYVSHLWLAINCADPLGRERTRYQISVDGEATPSVSSTLAGFHAADLLPNSNFATRYIGYNHLDTQSGYYAYIPIPFRSSIKIDIVNGSSSAAATLFAIADYHTRVPLAWGRMGKLHTFEQVVKVTPYAWQDLLNVTAQPKSVLWGVYLATRGGDPGFGYLEGNVEMYVDGSGSPNYESSGTEDYFNNTWYFQTGVICAEHSGCTHYDPTDYSIGAYRFHVDDPVPFDDALHIRWQNGSASEGMVVNPTSLRSHVWYYTAS